jgi:chromosomal replication initiator protein
MLDCVTEIPLAGRILAPPNAGVASNVAREPLPAFVAGPENQLVAGAIGELMRGPAIFSDAGVSERRFAPSLLVLFGASGTGKTHLACGLTRHWQSLRGEESSLYTTAADFRHLLYDAVKRQAELEFRAGIRGRQLLVIDDLQHLPADEHALQELRYTLDDYADRGATVVVTSNEPIAMLPNLPHDIRSRLAGGLAIQLAAPGEAARGRIIRQAATALGRPLTDAAADRLAQAMDGTAHSVFSALFQLCAGGGPRVSDERQVEQLLAARAARRPTLREIMAIVARQQNVPQSQLKSSSRRQSIVFARGLVAFLARELAGATYEQIGRALGGRDHTTILHAYQKIARSRESDPQLHQTLEQLRRLLATC